MPEQPKLFISVHDASSVVLVSTVVLDELVHEAEAYTRLESLQGDVLPTFFFYSSSFLDKIHLFAMEYAGKPLNNDGRISPIVAEQMRCALRSVH